MAVQAAPILSATSAQPQTTACVVTISIPSTPVILSTTVLPSPYINNARPPARGFAL